MLDNLQTTFNFYGNGTLDAQLSPKGYKGFAGFHKYWGKKPTEVWRFLIGNLTSPQDIVLDPFLGAGLIAKTCISHNCRLIGFDVNPISIALTKLYLNPPDYIDLRNAIYEIERRVKPLINAMYLVSDGNIATHLLWDNDQITQVWTKRNGKRIELNLNKHELSALQNVATYHPQRLRELRLFDNSRINSQKTLTLTELFSPRALRAIDLIKAEIERFSGDLKRALNLILSASVGQMSNMVFAVSRRGKTEGIETGKIEVGSWTIGYWCPAQHFEINAWNCYAIKANKLLKAVGEAGDAKPVTISPSLNSLLNQHETVYVQQGDAAQLLTDVPTESIKVIITDPPHGDRIPYLELSEMWNSVLCFDSNYEDELVVSNAKGRGKDIRAYNEKLTSIFHQCARVLEKDGFLIIMFNARAAAYWQSLRQLEAATGLAYIGCYPSAYSAGSILQDNRKGGLKTDFVLLYGKQISEKNLEKTVATFSDVKGWTTRYPKESE